MSSEGRHGPPAVVVFTDDTDDESGPGPGADILPRLSLPHPEAVASAVADAALEQGRNAPILESRPAVRLRNGTLYSGQWSTELQHGEGVLDIPGGNRYCGHFRDGLFDGHGHFASFDGTYEGQWVKGHADGLGTFVSDSGRKYVGSWHRDRRVGTGTEEEADGSRYEGEFRSDKRHGRGEYRDKDGGTYTGEFTWGEKEGSGTCRWIDGQVYVGEWQRGKMHGQGTLSRADGSSYDGYFFHGQQEGQGIAKWPNNISHRGGWRAGLRHGAGIAIDAEGREAPGRWLDGKLLHADL